MKKFIILLVLISTSSCKSQGDSPVQVIDIKTFSTEVIGKQVQLLDVRTAGEFEKGHIDDAVNIDVSNLDAFTEKAKKLDKSKPVYIYCQMGGRSQRAAKQLQALGFETIYDYSGGYSEWSGQNK